MAYIDDLMEFGLTRQESVIYYTLLSEGSMTGYEAAKASGVSRSNTYTALAALVDKGAAYVEEGTPTKYIPVKVTEFCHNKLSWMNQLAERLVEYQPKTPTEVEGYITISGFKNISQKIKYMIQNAEYRIYMTATAEIMNIFREDIEELVKKEFKVVLITEAPYQMEGAIIYHTNELVAGQIGLIVDSANVLTGDFSSDENCVCLYSGKKNLIDLFKQSMSRQIQLIQLQQK